MRIRINLLSLLRTALRIAGTVQTVVELILATQGQRAADAPTPVDLDELAGRGNSGAPPAAAAEPPAGGYPADPSAAH
jgi:hypothetical protein